MKTTTKYDAVIFDMDGLMFDTERIGFEGFQQGAVKYGYETGGDFFKTLVGMTVVDADEAMKKNFGDEFPIPAVRAERVVYIEQIRHTTGIPVKTGLHELLEYLKQHNIPMAIATSSSRAVVEEHLSHAGISDYFQTILCGDEITKGKPNPEIYLKTAKRLGVSPARCIVLEDSFLGVRAAHAANMIPIMVPDMHQPTNEIRKLTHKVFSSLVEVSAYLDKMNTVE